MVICPDCGKEVPDANFCKNCGAALPKESEVKESNDGVFEDVEEDIIGGETVEAQNEIHSESSDNKIKFCHNCGCEIEGNFQFCPDCGCVLKNETPVSKPSHASVVVREEKNIVLSVILSVIIPGLGHFYLGLSRKGAIFLLAYVISAILILLLIGLLLVIVIWIWALVDVIISTNALNRGEDVEDKLF